MKKDDETFGKRPLRVPELLRSRADVVPARVSQHIIQRLFLGYVPPRLPNHDRELGLVVARAVLTQLRHADLVRVRPPERGAGFDEQDRVSWDGHLGLPGVVTVVEPEAADDGDVVGGDGG